jgi:DNA-binding transcriptional ArsR family regulator
VTSSSEPVAVRYVSDVETLRVLSDPLRLAMVNLIMRGGDAAPVWTAKELAKELGEPKTKLYRHLRQLLAARLIQVSGTRLVSGIVEHQYRAGQLSLRIDEAFLGGSTPVDDTLLALRAVLDNSRDELFEAVRAGTVRLGEPRVPDAPVQPTVAALHATIPLARAQDFAARLSTLVNEFVELGADPDGVAVRMLITYHQVHQAS